MTQSDLEWPRTAMEIVWMTQYDFKWVKSTSASPFRGPSDLDILIYSAVTHWHLRERPPYCELVFRLYTLIISKKWFFLNMPLNFPSFCDDFFAFKTAADYVYISESI